MRRLLILIALLTVSRVADAQVPETIEYYAQDAIGSIRVVFTPTGAIVARQDYAPFGRPLFPAPAMPKEGFGGNEKDDESDQAYFHARIFQARTGRFTRPDPVYNALFEPQAWNRYAYALNNPIRFVDADGLDVFKCPTKEAVVVAEQATVMDETHENLSIREIGELEMDHKTATVRLITETTKDQRKRIANLSRRLSLKVFLAADS